MTKLQKRTENLKKLISDLKTKQRTLDLQLQLYEDHLEKNLKNLELESLKKVDDNHDESK